MSITFDTQKWSSPWRARDIEEAEKRPVSPRVVSVEEMGFFKSSVDIKGDAFFRLFTDEDSKPYPNRER